MIKTRYTPKPGDEIDPLRGRTSITEKDCEECDSYLSCAIDGRKPAEMPSAAMCKYVQEQIATMLKKRGG
jgi:hypothetical protein